MTPLLFLEVLYPQSRQSAGILAHLYLHTFPLPIGDSGLVVADISKIRITAAGTAPDSHRIPSHQKKENFPDYRFYMAKVKKIGLLLRHPHEYFSTQTTDVEKKQQKSL